MFSRRRGASAPEIVFIVLIIGVLLAIVLPRITHMFGDRAAPGELQGDLEKVVAAQEAYFAEHKAYAADTSVLRAAKVTPGTVITFGPATATGWSATTSNPHLSAITCSVFYGDAQPRPPATVAGQIACK